MTLKEVKKILKDYKDYLNKEHKGMYCKISDYSLDKYVKEKLTSTDVVGEIEQLPSSCVDFLEFMGGCSKKGSCQKCSK